MKILATILLTAVLPILGLRMMFDSRIIRSAANGDPVEAEIDVVSTPDGLMVVTQSGSRLQRNLRYCQHCDAIAFIGSACPNCKEPE